MANLPSNLPSILRSHGLKVVEISGWKTRGRPASTGAFAPVGVLCHHTASSANGKGYASGTLVKGRSDLPGPLCQISIDRQGVVYIVAAGRANHAGEAKSSGTVAAGDGNKLYIGIEAQNRGTGEKWPKVQYDAYVLTSAVLSAEVTHNSHDTVRAHKETSKTGKIDPFGPTPYEGSFDMGKFRARVEAKMKVLTAPKPAPKPTTPAPAKKTLSVMSWNVEDKNDGEADVAALAKLLATHKPDVVCIQEGYRLYLSGIPGYREVYHASKGYPVNSENRAQAIMVRDGVAVKVKSPIAMALSWVGPKMGVKKEPRVHRYVTVNKDKLNWRVSTWHVPFGAKPVEETRLAAVSWLKQMGVLGPAVAVGDWNALADGLQAKVGTPGGAKVDGGGLDKAVFRGCTKVKGENFGKQGRSDHDAKMWTWQA